MDSFHNVVILKKGQLHFGYRSSNLDGAILLEAHLRVEPQDKEAVERRCRELMSYKQKTQDFSHSNAGCIFKNPPPPQFSSGELIELSGLKGMRVGDAQVSPKHGNFIVNLGKATAADIYALIEQVRTKVQKDHRVWLELEVREL